VDRDCSNLEGFIEFRSRGAQRYGLISLNSAAKKFPLLSR